MYMYIYIYVHVMVTYIRFLNSSPADEGLSAHQQLVLILPVLRARAEVKAHLGSSGMILGCC